MPAGGTVTIATHVVSAAEAELIGLAAQPWVRLRVRDTGVGMTPEIRARIFEPFFTTKERGKGTGLGLALVYAMVEQAGGEVRVESAPGRGSTFDLYFPRVDAAPSAAQVASGFGEEVGGAETILLAEDEDAVRAVMVSALSRRGYRVLQAVDGEAAITVATTFAGTIHLLITDVVMPGARGREVAAVVQRLRPNIQVLYCSGYTDDAVLMGDVRIDERRFLQKPFTAQELVRRVRTVLDLAGRS
jgi:CheY-like chemotaxis protein